MPISRISDRQAITSGEKLSRTGVNGAPALFLRCVAMQVKLTDRVRWIRFCHNTLEATVPLGKPKSKVARRSYIDEVAAQAARPLHIIAY